MIVLIIFFLSNTHIINLIWPIYSHVNRNKLDRVVDRVKPGLWFMVHGPVQCWSDLFELFDYSNSKDRIVVFDIRIRSIF